jgi:hypothetical protein
LFYCGGVEVNALSCFTTEDLIEELRSRSRSYAIAYTLPDNSGDVIFTWNKDDFYKSLGLARGLVIDMESGAKYDLYKYHQENDEDEREEDFVAG